MAKKTAVPEKKRRLQPEARKAQIIEATKELILEKGLAWASVIRISEALNISQATLYYHFRSRREILLETLSSIINESLLKIMATRPSGNAEEFIRQAARSVYELTLADPRQSRLIFEFLCAPATENLREEMQIILSSSIDIIGEALSQGIKEGLFRADIDVTVVAWEIASLGLAFNIGIMLEMPKFLTMEQALGAVDGILAGIRMK